MLRISLRFLRTPVARRAVRPPRSAAPSLSAVSGACRPKSSAAAPADATLAAPRDDPPPTKINVAIDAETDDDDMEDMFVDTSMGKEWGGPTRGGRMPEPTRFGDWERKGRATDF